MESFDVVIVGGGPVGCAVGRLCAEAGNTVAIIEEHEEIGVPLHCAGLVTERAFAIPGLDPEGLILNSITGATIYSPKGSPLTIGGDRTHAVVIDRVRYDQALAKMAARAGAVLFTGLKVIDLQQIKDGVAVNYGSKIMKGRILVGADGARSTVRSQFPFSAPKEYLESIGAEVEGVGLQSQTVLIFTGSHHAPGFFSWVIPLNRQGTKARIGLCKTKGAGLSLKECFARLLQEPALAGCEVLSWTGGLVPLGVVDPCVQGRVLLVGDAAAQVKPMSGGGIVSGLWCARQCARTINETLTKKTRSSRELARYQVRWKRVVGRELAWGMRFRGLYRQASDDRLESWFSELRRPGVAAAISRDGDIDYPSRVLLPVLAAAPGLALKVPGVLLSRRG